MGLFHCPVGAAGRGGDGCIDCGLCVAGSKAERAEATRRIRAYIRATAQQDTRRFIRKIALCGKGGAGKSTVTALLSKALEQLGYESFVIDTDHSNAGLWRKLGLSQAPPPIYGLEGAEKEALLGWMSQELIAFDEVPQAVAPSVGRRRLLAVGKLEDPLEGCACAMGAYARQLIQNLATGDGQMVLADQEAGVESFGRGVEAACDTVLIVVEPSGESLQLAGKIQEMAQGLGIRRVRAILNKIETQAQLDFMEEALSDAGVRYLGHISAAPQVSMANLRGMPPEDPAALAQMERLAKLMLDEAEMRYLRRDKKGEVPC